LGQQRTCCATIPPSSLLSFTYVSTDDARSVSNSSTDSGTGSAGGCFGGNGGVETAEASGGDTTDWPRASAGTSLGSSVVVAMSSRRDVAASRLGCLVSVVEQGELARHGGPAHTEAKTLRTA